MHEPLWLYALLALAVFVIGTFGGLAAVAVILVKLPADYFSNDSPRPFWADKHPVLRRTGLVLKNIVGLVLVVLGAALSLPGIPGPGVLTLLIGLTLLDFPGKRPLERWFVSRPSVLRTINRLRHRYGKPPLAPPFR